MLVWEIRERLVRDGVCKPTALPSLSTLTRMLRDADSGTDESNLSNERTTTTTTTTTTQHSSKPRTRRLHRQSHAHSLTHAGGFLSSLPSDLQARASHVRTGRKLREGLGNTRPHQGGRTATERGGLCLPD